MFTKATKYQSKLRLALCGVSGSGKTYSALEIAKYLGASTALIDTEHGSASKYADLFDFDTCSLVNHHPNKYIEAIKAAVKAGYEVLVIDSLSHAWFHELDMVNHFGDWKKVRPLERALIDTMLSSPCHIIATMRTKTQWVMEEYQAKDGKTKEAPRRVGTSPIQTSGIEYEFDLSGEMDLNHVLTISKSRCPNLADTTHHCPGEKLAGELQAWLSAGVQPPESGQQPPESEQSKCVRVREAREAVGLSMENVKELLFSEFGRTSPSQLSSTECDRLIEMIDNLSAD